MIVGLWGVGAWACGGFFCDNVEPVEQAGERILFREEPDGQWTTFVEIQFRGPPVDFAWVVPVERILDPEVDIGVGPAGLFDELEAATAPRFLGSPDAAAEVAAQAGSACTACGTGSFAEFPDTSGVEVVGQAVVGPYAVEMITAGEGDNLTAWLQRNGYRIPASASPPIEAYIADGFSFLGVKLLPDVPSGPIDTLVIDCGSTEPTIPLLLTAIAAISDMPITVYTLGSDRYVPVDPWPEIEVPPWTVSFVGDAGDTDYDLRLREATRDHRGFHTEAAGPVDRYVAALSPEGLDALGHGDVLTRMRTFVSPDQMTSDPVFVADPDAPDVDHVHQLDGPQGAAIGLGAGLGLLWMGLGFARRRLSDP